MKKMLLVTWFLGLIVALSLSVEEKKIFQLMAVDGGPFHTKEEALKPYGGELAGDLIILEGTTKDWFVVKAQSVITTQDFQSVTGTKDSMGNPAVLFTLKPEPAEKLKLFTTMNRGKRLAMVLDNRVMMAPVVQTVISKEFIIIGNYTWEEIEDIVKQTRSAMGDAASH